MEAVVSTFKEIKSLYLIVRRPTVECIVEPDDIWWFIFGAIPFCCMHFAYANLWPHTFGRLMPFSWTCVFFVHVGALLSVIYGYEVRPFQLIGAKMKFLVLVIPMIIAAALHNLLAYNLGYLSLQLCISTYLYFFAHFMRVAYDIEGVDVLLGLFLQVLMYMLNGDLLVRALAMNFCLGLCFYRYKTYRAPEVTTYRKEELERLPC